MNSNKLNLTNLLTWKHPSVVPLFAFVFFTIFWLKIYISDFKITKRFYKIKLANQIPLRYSSSCCSFYGFELEPSIVERKGHRMWIENFFNQVFLFLLSIFLSIVLIHRLSISEINLRTSAGARGTRICLVLMQNSNPIAMDDPIAGERAAMLCQSCQISTKQLFILPLGDQLHGYIIRCILFSFLKKQFLYYKMKFFRP